MEGTATIILIQHKVLSTQSPVQRDEHHDFESSQPVVPRKHDRLIRALMFVDEILGPFIRVPDTMLPV